MNQPQNSIDNNANVQGAPANGASANLSNKRSAGHRAFTVIGVVLCVILIPIVIINCTLIAKQFLGKDKVPSVGGVFPMIVLTDSMAGTFDGGSLLFCKTADAKDIKVGDIICYFDPSGNGTTTTTHRVKEIQTDDAGNISFITKGDANNTEDKLPVPASKLVGTYWFHIAGLGSVAMFMQTTPGLIIFVIVPILLLVIYDIIRRRLYDRQKDSETSALEEELRVLRAQKAAQDAGNAQRLQNVPSVQVPPQPQVAPAQNIQPQQNPQPRVQPTTDKQQQQPQKPQGNPWA